jgi:uncharacterized tellurite resistance protein B-like protein
MFGSFRKLFEERVAPQAADTSAEARESALHLAAAALLFEVMRADGAVAEEEKIVMRTAVQSTFGLSREEAEELARLAEAAARDSVSIYEFTHTVDRELPREEKKRLVELLWLVVFADAEKDAYEERMVRKIAGLLHVEHPDFIDAKLRARERSRRGER